MKTDLEKILSLDVVDNGDSSFDEFRLLDTKTNVVVGKSLSQEGDNGKSHGQRGHRKAHLYFNFNKNGTLMDAMVYVPSLGQTFTFLENTVKE